MQALRIHRLRPGCCPLLSVFQSSSRSLIPYLCSSFILLADVYLSFSMCIWNYFFQPLCFFLLYISPLSISSLLVYMPIFFICVQIVLFRLAPFLPVLPMTPCLHLVLQYILCKIPPFKAQYVQPCCMLVHVFCKHYAWILVVIKVDIPGLGDL